MIPESVVNFHFKVPLEFIAYRFPSLEPTKIVPSADIAGDDSISPPVIKDHFFVPSGLSAYNLLSSEPK